MTEIKFRPHKGGLRESLALERIVTCGNDIKQFYKDDVLTWRLLDFSSFRCEFYAKDFRGIGYDDTYVIKAKYTICGIDQEIILGYTNKEVKF